MALTGPILGSSSYALMLLRVPWAWRWIGGVSGFLSREIGMRLSRRRHTSMPGALHLGVIRCPAHGAFVTNSGMSRELFGRRTVSRPCAAGSALRRSRRAAVLRDLRLLGRDRATFPPSLSGYARYAIRSRLPPGIAAGGL